MLAAFAVLDWYPTVRDLGRLRRERGDLERKIRDHARRRRAFKFPDEKEKSLLAAADAELGRALPVAESDDHWLGSALSGTAAARKGAEPHSDPVISALPEKMAPGAPGLTAWLKLRAGRIRQGFQAADPRHGYPWRGFFRPWLPAAASWPVAPWALPWLRRCLALGFINHISWGGPAWRSSACAWSRPAASARAWLVCRGIYRAPEPSAWRVEPAAGGGEEELLIDPDSPLLLRRVDPLLAPRVEKRELPPAGSPW